MVLKLYEYNKKDNTYFYCGGYLTFKGYEDLAKYLYSLMCDLLYDTFVIDLIKDITCYSFKDLNYCSNGACLCLFTTKYNGVSTHYKICLGKED